VTSICIHRAGVRLPLELQLWQYRSARQLLTRCLLAYPSTVPIDSTRPFPFVSVLIRSVSVLKALGLIWTICSSALSPTRLDQTYSFPFLSRLLLLNLLTFRLDLLSNPLGIFTRHRNPNPHPHTPNRQDITFAQFLDQLQCLGFRRFISFDREADFAKGFLDHSNCMFTWGSYGWIDSHVGY
jgi:hypothetical protein